MGQTGRPCMNESRAQSTANCASRIILPSYRIISNYSASKTRNSSADEIANVNFLYDDVYTQYKTQ